MPATQGYRRRNTLRHRGYDYTRPGAYFVTICAHQGRTVFGRVVDGTMRSNALGKLAHEGWRRCAERNENVDVDAFVVMPNHVYVLLWIRETFERRETTGLSPQRKFGNATAGSLSSLVGGYKSGVTQRAIRRALIPGPPLWQRNFYDRIVRGDAELRHIREYIRTNPARWRQDQLHPSAPPNRFNRT